MIHSKFDKPLGRFIAPAGLALALLVAAAEALAGPGSRWGWWHYRTGFEILGSGAIAGAVAAIVSLVGGILAGPHRTAYRMAVAGIVIGLIAAGTPWSWSQTAKLVPKIHDISTDTINPPQLIAVLPLRKNAENPATYGGPKVAQKQNLAYPDIQPLILPLPKDAAFMHAVRIARDTGWDLSSINAGEGRIEGTATTFWFGFKDDVVVRITPVPEGSRIDIRSVSRVGKGDVGTNAKRVRKFLKKMKSAGD
jgi:uncharacterized protein (DUF1499 family)